MECRPLRQWKRCRIAFAETAFNGLRKTGENSVPCREHGSGNKADSAWKKFFSKPDGTASGGED
ncbi:hypothetical protein B8V81_2337 [Paenibacillus pasadenensis]|uniref:Uncharacterized protein n=1 Tax=Paenibacillus pasadenensis TaxID=217090 RepID=A0A2N5N0Q3_9BACL|nr:hypothetical protein B8V81_2337 [Paenibacillus pasadenensis]